MMESRGLGAWSHVQRGLSQAKWEKEIELFPEMKDWEHQIKYPAMSIWQFSLIGWIDDVANHKKMDPKGHTILYDYFWRGNQQNQTSIWECERDKADW